MWQEVSHKRLRPKVTRIPDHLCVVNYVDMYKGKITTLLKQCLEKKSPDDLDFTN